MELIQFISSGHTPVTSKHSHSGAKSLTAQFLLQLLRMSFALLALGFHYCCIEFLCSSITYPHLLPASSLFTVPLI